MKYLERISLVTMPANKYITTPVKELIVQARLSQETFRDISARFHVHKATIIRLCNRWASEKNVSRRPKSGRPKKTTNREERRLVRLVKADPRMTASDLANESANILPVSLSRWTAGRILRRARLYARRPAKKPFISKKNRSARVQFARRYLSWRAEDWKRVLFSDESKFNIFSSDGIRYVRRPPGTRYEAQYQVPTVKHGGGHVMVWGKLYSV